MLLSQDAAGTSVDTTFEGFTLYKHRSSAVWVRGTGPRVRNAFVADSAVGVRLLPVTPGDPCISCLKTES